MKNELTYEQVLSYVSTDWESVASKNEFLTEGVLREILREEAKTKSEIPEGIPYYERIGFLKEYCRKQLLVEVVDHLTEQADDLTVLVTKL